jgi:hypothetical protein
LPGSYAVTPYNLAPLSPLVKPPQEGIRRVPESLPRVGMAVKSASCLIKLAPTGVIARL